MKKLISMMIDIKTINMNFKKIIWTKKIHIDMIKMTTIDMNKIKMNITLMTL